MRSASAIISLIVGGHEELVEAVADIVVRQRSELSRDLERIRSEVRYFLVHLCEGLFYGCVLHVSDSVGLPALAPSYKRVVEKDGALEFRLINLAIQLDHFSGFPEEDLEKLEKELVRKPSSHNVLRRLVWRHLYLFPVNYRLRQNLCQRFAIQITPVLMDQGLKQTGDAPQRGRRASKRRKR
jgi:hypothetical protein